ncbi:MAG TPA: hypothetical protein VGB78_05680 [Thermoplasmata archaeon]
MASERTGKREKRKLSTVARGSSASGGLDLVELVRILSAMDFDDEKLIEVDCPQCGEHVRLQNGRCPQCSEMICDSRADRSCDKVIPVVKGGSIVFLHLDVQAGCLDYLESDSQSGEPAQLTLDFDGVDPEVIDENWEDSIR